jgi:hypothetical protein
VELIQEIGSYAGFAAVVGLAILSALYFSQARDVKRLREWAGRAPERAAEIDSGGRAAAAVPVAARPQPQVRPVTDDAEPATGVQPAGAAAAGAGAAAAPVAAASAGASPAAATAGVPAGNGTEEGADQDDEIADANVEGDADEAPAAAPAAATPAGAVASAAGTAERSDTAAQGAATPAGSDTGTGAKVLPARRPVPPVRPRPTIPPRPIPPRPGQTSVLGQAPGSRPPARGGRNWPAPRYIALIVAGIVILGLGGTVGVLQLTKDEDKPATEDPVSLDPDTNVGDPTAEPDDPEPARVNPAAVTVTVLNATNTTGLAVRVLSQLEQLGFRKGSSGNANERQRAESVVMYKPGKKEAAVAVARKLDIGSTQAIDQETLGLAGLANVVVVLGADKADQ